MTDKDFETEVNPAEFGDNHVKMFKEVLGNVPTHQKIILVSYAIEAFTKYLGELDNDAMVEKIYEK